MWLVPVAEFYEAYGAYMFLLLLIHSVGGNGKAALICAQVGDVVAWCACSRVCLCVCVMDGAMLSRFFF